MEVIICTNCGKKFAYQLEGNVYPGGKDREVAMCPYCGEIGYSEMTSQTISVYKIDQNGDIVRN